MNRRKRRWQLNESIAFVGCRSISGADLRVLLGRSSAFLSQNSTIKLPSLDKEGTPRPAVAAGVV